MKDIEKLQKDISAIKARNKSVEADKAWEISLTRRLFVAGSTYLLISLFMIFIGVENPFLSAFVPSLGYLLSTLSLTILKKWWIERRETSNLQE